MQIDKCKLGKRKYYRGHAVQGEDTAEKKVFLIEVLDISTKTLTSCILQHVLPGSIIITDCWKGYAHLENYYDRHTVNHSKNFKDSQTRVTTN